jgi:hypothetical protein
LDRMKITEEQFENHLLGIRADLGYVYENGYEIAPTWRELSGKILKMEAV